MVSCGSSLSLPHTHSDGIVIADCLCVSVPLCLYGVWCSPIRTDRILYCLCVCMWLISTRCCSLLSVWLITMQCTALALPAMQQHEHLAISDLNWPALDCCTRLIESLPLAALAPHSIAAIHSTPIGYSPTLGNNSACCCISLLEPLISPSAPSAHHIDQCNAHTR